jgi:hypothetical protein
MGAVGGRAGPAIPRAVPGVLRRQPAAPVPRGGGVHDENVRVVEASTGEVILALPGQLGPDPSFLLIVSLIDMRPCLLSPRLACAVTESSLLNPPTGHRGDVRQAVPYYLADGRIRLLTASDDQAATLRVGPIGD